MKQEQCIKLTPCQQAAIEYMEQYAAKRRDKAKQTVEGVLKMSNVDPLTAQDALAKIKAHAQVALHFHPDRPDAEMKTVAEALIRQGVYRSQFETQLSNGSVTAYPGGQRDMWEQQIFGGAYQHSGVTNRERPKYGALDLLRFADGPAPGFGSCYLLLSPEVTNHCTFTYLDSHQDPKQMGTLDEFDDLFAALLQETFFRHSAIGQHDMTMKKLFDRLNEQLGTPLADPSSRTASRNLYHYIEAQVHGEILLERDAETLVADPSFQYTKSGDVLRQLCEKYDIGLLWHMGFVLNADNVPNDFRGPEMPSLARRVARGGILNAAMIGDAAMGLKRDANTWSDRGSYEEVLQELKCLWHVLVRYGEPQKE